MNPVQRYASLLFFFYHLNLDLIGSTEGDKGAEGRDREAEGRGYVYEVSLPISRQYNVGLGGF